MLHALSPPRAPDVTASLSPTDDKTRQGMPFLASVEVSSCLTQGEVLIMMAGEVLRERSSGRQHLISPRDLPDGLLASTQNTATDGRAVVRTRPQLEVAVAANVVGHGMHDQRSLYVVP